MDSKLLLTGLDLDKQGLKQLLDSQQLVDCTLACDGGKIKAHKIVLTACSSYLAKILHDHPVEHPIIILPELKIEDVRTLVHYMYTGELLKSSTVDSTHLLRTAAILSVNSLSDFLNGSLSQVSPGAASNKSKNANSSNIIDDSYNSNNHSPTMDSITSKSLHGSNSLNNTFDSNETTITGTTTSEPHNKSSISNNSQLQSSTLTLNGNNSISLASSSDFRFKCPVCQNDFQTICSFEYHMQRIHNVTSFGCEICHKPFASLRYVLTDHMRRCHGWRADQKLRC